MAYMETTFSKREQQKRETRTAIINAVMKIIITEGKQGITSRKITELAGVGKGTIYTHFNTMDELMLETVLSTRDHALEVLAAKTFTGVHQFIFEIGEYTIQSMIDNYEMVQAFINFSYDFFGNPKYIKMQRDTWANMTRYIEVTLRDLSGGSISEELRTSAARIMLNHIAGIKIVIISDIVDAEELKRDWAAMADILYDYVQGK